MLGSAAILMKEIKGLFADRRTDTVWAQAGNRLHAQKALLEYLIGS